MEIKLAALDLDDTTLNSEAKLSEETEKTIDEAIERGMEIVIASGRSFASLPKRLVNKKGLHFAITSNGSAIERLPSGERIMSHTLDISSVERVLELFPDEVFECFINGQAYCDSRYYDDPASFGCSPAYVDYVKTTRIPIFNMRGFIENNKSRLDSIDIQCRKSERRERIFSLALGIENVYVTSSSARLVEISDKNAGKGSALRFLSDYLGIAPENIAAFGNGENDADMLKFAGIGVAVENANDTCKEAANIICESNNDNGVAKALRSFWLCSALPHSTSE